MKINKNLSILLSVLVLFSFISPISYAINDNTKVESTSFYEQRIKEIDEEIFNAKSKEDIKKLIKEYNEILELNEYRMKSISRNSDYPEVYYAPNGGTLVLRKDDPDASPKNITYNRIDYYNQDQAFVIYKMLSDTGFKSYFKSLGLGAITEKAAEEIAAYLGLSKKYGPTIIGFSIGTIQFILENLDKWDFEEAHDRSRTGGVKLVHYTVISNSFPYYQEIENYEPWNDSYMRVPFGYSVRRMYYGHKNL